MKAVLLLNGEVTDYPAAAAFIETLERPRVIACDGGLRHARALGVVPELILGDLDSAPAGLLREYGFVPVEKHPAAKDATDTELAVGRCLSGGVRELYVIGGFGDRLDHVTATMHVLAKAAESGAAACMWDAARRVYLHAGGVLRIERGAASVVSLIPLSPEVTGVTTRGLVYPLTGETLCFGSSRGVSNAFTEDAAEVRTAGGLLAVMAVNG
jgi:thiamine pyrophosphokinase